jgi:beta-glucosidase
MLVRSRISEFSAPDFFLWATGIEDTFITAPWPATGRTLDEYELTQHYQHWKTDISLMKELGVPAARYGIPWHRIQPQPNRWDWDWADKTLNWMLELGIEPILDLVHYGLPPWLEGAFSHPDFSKYMADYSGRVAERFQGRVFAYTPLNEPRVTAWYCGKLGWWPPFKRGWRGFLEVMIGVCRGIVESVKAIEDAHPENLAVHVDATDLYETADRALLPEAAQRQEIVFLALDLVSGRVTEEHKLWSWLLKNGVDQKHLDWFQENATTLHFIGINLYPMFSRKILKRDSHGLRMSMPYSDANIIERLAQLYFTRYQCPLFISETASVGSIARRERWLEDSILAVRRTRERGIPLMGCTWWPLFALVTWAYRQGTHPAAYYLKQMGLWDLLSENNILSRNPTRLVDRYKELVRAGAGSVGLLEEGERIAHV